MIVRVYGDTAFGEEASDVVVTLAVLAQAVYEDDARAHRVGSHAR
jgi:hypothetical protein